MPRYFTAVDFDIDRKTKQLQQVATNHGRRIAVSPKAFGLFDPGCLWDIKVRHCGGLPLSHHLGDYLIRLNKWAKLMHMLTVCVVSLVQSWEMAAMETNMGHYLNCSDLIRHPAPCHPESLFYPVVLCVLCLGSQLSEIPVDPEVVLF